MKIFLFKQKFLESLPKRFSKTLLAAQFGLDSIRHFCALP